MNKTNQFRVNIYVATKDGEKLLKKGKVLYSQDEAERMTDRKNIELGHNPSMIIAKSGTKFAMYDDA